MWLFRTENYLDLKEKYILPFANNMDRSGRHCEDTERQILHNCHLDVEPKKYNKLVNVTKKDPQ